MHLGEILHPGVIRPALGAPDKFAAIEELVQVLVDAGELPATLREAALRSALARERSAPTGMEMGIAMPHGSVSRLDRLVGALGISESGLDFGGLDGQPAHVVLLLLLPRDQFRVQVKTLAAVAHLLSQEEFRAELLDAKDADAIMRLIRGEERQPGFLRWFGRRG